MIVSLQEKELSKEKEAEAKIKHLRQLNFEDMDYEKFDLEHNIFEELVKHEASLADRYKVSNSDNVIQENGNVTSIVLFLNRLNEYYIKISNETTINDLFEISSDCLKEVLNSYNVTFLMKDKFIINIYTEENRGFGTNIMVDEQYYVVARYNRKFTNKTKIVRDIKIKKEGEYLINFEPCFENLESAVYGRVLKKKICQAVINQKMFKRIQKPTSEVVY